VPSRNRIPIPRAVPIPDIRLIAIDLDGTLLTDSKQISRKTVSALDCVKKREVKIIIASARPPRSVRHVYERLGLDTWQINYNGALIWDEAAKKVIYHCPMPGERVRAIVEIARSKFTALSVSCEVLDRWYTDRQEQPYTTETGRLFKPDVIAPLKDFCNQPITKLMFLADRLTIDKLEQFLAEQNDGSVTIVRTDAEILQIMDKSVSKAVALQLVAEHYNVPLANVMAIGDAPNDVGILQLAGIAVAMDNAYEVTKSVADWIAPSNNDHGVHAALVRYGLCD
jgi:Cof subfamily protein (haloacid dehalogenase superfamily)